MIQCIAFVGPSGGGKSFLMTKLAKSYPQQFCIPTRYTTRSGRDGDAADGVVSLPMTEFLQWQQAGKLAVVNCQNQESKTFAVQHGIAGRTGAGDAEEQLMEAVRAEGQNLNFSGYLNTDLCTSEGPIPLIFLSVFDVEEAATNIPGLFVVLVRSEWNQGLAIRKDLATAGTDDADTKANLLIQQQRRTDLNDSLKAEFQGIEDAVQWPATQGSHLAGLVFRHQYDGEVAPLMADLCAASATRGYQSRAEDSEKGVLLRSVFPLLAVSNIRGLDQTIQDGKLPPLWSWRLLPGSTDAPLRGQVGDLVIGDVIAVPKKKRGDVGNEDLAMLDSTHHWTHRSTTELRVLAALGNRESSTHVNGGVPEGGLMVPTPNLDTTFEEEETGESSPRKKTSLREIYGSSYHQPKWITPNSGLVGVLLSDGSSCNPLSESSTGFRLLGLLRLPTQAQAPNLSVKALAVNPTTTMHSFNTPIICIGATSAEAGKTTLTRKVVQALTTNPHNLRLAGIKATGTGGIQDSAEHRAAGAFCAVDQVTSGLPTTYVSPTEFSDNIWKSFCHCQDQGAEVILCEMGGDICWANNPTLLKTPWFQRNLVHMFVICNDSLAMVGARAYLQAEIGDSQSAGSAGYGIDLTTKVSFVASPFRNHTGALARAGSLGFEGAQQPLDPNRPALAVQRVVKSLNLHKEAQTAAMGSAPKTTLDASAGQPGILHDFWSSNALEEPRFPIATQPICVTQGIGYQLQHSSTHVTYPGRETQNSPPEESASLPCAKTPSLHTMVEELHLATGNNVALSGGRVVPSAEPPSNFVSGVGARQLVSAALHAVTRAPTWSHSPRHAVFLYSPRPCYSAYKRILAFLSLEDSVGQVISCETEQEFLEAVPDSGDKTSLKIVLDSSPRNPDGSSLSASPQVLSVADAIILDSSYNWPHLVPPTSPTDPATVDSRLKSLQCDREAFMKLYEQSRKVVIQIFSLSKLTGHASTRFGWAWIGTGNENSELESAVVREMRRFIRFHTIGVSLEAEARAVKVLSWLRGGVFTTGPGAERSRMYRLWVHGITELHRRWNEDLLPLLSSCPTRSAMSHGQDYGVRPGWCFLLFKFLRPAVATQSYQEHEVAMLNGIREKCGIQVSPGSELGFPTPWQLETADGKFNCFVVRIHLGVKGEEWPVLLEAINKLMTVSY